MALPVMTTRILSQSQERGVAKKLGGKTQPGSGNKWHAKGDIKSPKMLVEAKATFNTSITVKASVWLKIEDEATAIGKIPAMTLRMADGQGRELHLAVISVDEFCEHFK